MQTPRSTYRPAACIAALYLALAMCLPCAAVEPAAVTVVVKPTVVHLTTSAARIDVRRRRFRLAVRRLQPKRRVVREARAGGLYYERAPERFRLGKVTAVEVLGDGVRVTVETTEGPAATVTIRFLTARTVDVDFEPPNAATVSAAGQQLRSPRRERIYGLTERLRDSPSLAPPVLLIPRDDIQPPEAGSLDRRGETVEMRILPTFSLYAPFYHSSSGYGLAVSGTTFGSFDLASSDSRTLDFRFELGTTDETRRLRYQIFVASDYATILDEYTNHTGRPFVPPDWAFRHWRWRGELRQAAPAMLDGVAVNADLADDVLQYDALGIPSGIYLFDRPVLAGNFGFARWQWDETRMPNPASMLASLTTRGYRLGTWSSTWVCGTELGDNGAEAAALGYLAPPGTGPTTCSDAGGNFVLDLTNPAAWAWWRDEVSAFLQPNDLRVIKLDRGEEHIPSAASDVWFDGRTGREVRNAYPLMQAELHYDALASAFPDGEFLVLTRSGYTGTQRYAVVWGGDIPASETFGAGPGTELGLRSAIVSQQRAAFMGYPIWGSDTGGYYQFKDREVFARWLEFSAFSGLMEIGGVGTHAPWDMPTVPAFDVELIDIYRRYTSLRETLLEYIVAAAAEASTGMPIVRPMPFLDRDDPELADRWDQYMFGPDLMVAPVWRSGQTSREVYFPKGTWTSYWDAGETHEGPRIETVAAPLDTIPAFVRGGAVVPRP